MKWTFKADRWVDTATTRGRPYNRSDDWGCFVSYTSCRYARLYPDLFAPLTDERKAAVSAALADDRLEGAVITREQVQLLIRSIMETMSDEQYVAEVLAHLSASDK